MVNAINIYNNLCLPLLFCYAYIVSLDNREKTVSTPNLQPSAQCYLLSFRGNALRQGSAWRASRAAVLLLVTASVSAVALWLYVTSLDGDVTETLVSQAEFVSPQPRVYAVRCSEDYNNYKRYPGELS